VGLRQGERWVKNGDGQEEAKKQKAVRGKDKVAGDHHKGKKMYLAPKC